MASEGRDESNTGLPGPPAGRADGYFPAARRSPPHCHSRRKAAPGQNQVPTRVNKRPSGLLLTRADQPRALSLLGGTCLCRSQRRTHVSRRRREGGKDGHLGAWHSRLPARPPAPPPLPRFPQCTDSDPPRVQSVDLSSAAFLWSKVPPKFPSGQELVESLVFPLVALCRCQTTGPCRPPAFHGGLLSACDSISRVTPLGQRHRVSKRTRQGPRNPESLGAGAGEAVG